MPDDFTVSPKSVVRKFVSVSQTEEKLNKTATTNSFGIPHSSAMKTQALINWLPNSLPGNICVLQKAPSSCRIFCTFL
jgi:hypothetical protein